jgi:hypothetical protein
MKLSYVKKLRFMLRLCSFSMATLSVRLSEYVDRSEVAVI